VLVRRWTVVGDQVIHSRETADASHAGVRPLLLLHGVGTTTRYFRPLMHELEGRVPVVAPELPGIGSSSSAPVPEDIEDQADLVARWLRAARHRPVAVVGNSMGAQTAVELALRHPELVDRLVLIGPTIDRKSRGPLRQIGKLLVDATVERPSLIGLTITDSFLTRRRAVARYFRASLAHHLEERIPSVTVPVLAVRGERDPVVPRRWVRELAAAAPRGVWREVPGAHGCHHGRPREVAALLLEMLAPAGCAPTGAGAGSAA
jgi:2-hydroxy-6-oxonona-2,4-dienedioate hydrolase